MTTVVLHNGSTTQANPKRYIRIYSTSIEEVLDKKVIKINLPKTKSGWSAGPERISIDLLQVDRKFVITGKIDLTSNKTNSGVLPAITLVDADVANALIVKERINFMVDHGGVLTLAVGFALPDGYDSTRIYSVVVDRVSYKEIPQDQTVAPNYDITIECSVSTDR